MKYVRKIIEITKGVRFLQNLSKKFIIPFPTSFEFSNLKFCKLSTKPPCPNLLGSKFLIFEP